MNLQAIQDRLAAAGQSLQNIGHAISTKLHGVVISAGQAFKQIGEIIARPFLALHKALTSREVAQQDPPERRSSELRPNVRSHEEELESLLEGMEEIHVDLHELGDEDLSVPPQPQDRLDLDGGMPKLQEQKMDSFGERIGQLTKLGMVSGEQAVTDSGLVPDHVNKFKSVAKETHSILMFRPVNQMSTGLLQEGTAAKGLNVHGKSSDWGPMAGYIAKDQNLSKKHDDKGAIEKGISDNLHSLHDDGDRVGSSQLMLTSNRLGYLLENKLMVPCDEKGVPLDKSPESGPRFFLNGGQNKNDNYLFKLEPAKDGFSVSYKSAEGKAPVVGDPVSDWSPLEVMGGKVDKESAPIPLTADYDMFAMLPKIGDGSLIGNRIETWERPPMSEKMTQLTQQLGDAKERLANARESGNKELARTIRREVVGLGLKIAVLQRQEAQNAFAGIVDQARTKLLGQEERREIDPELGRLTSWQREMRTKLNDSVKVEGGYTGGDLVKHGTEQDNTQFSEKDEKVFVIMPNGDTFMTQSWEQTQAFMWAAKQDDFLTYTNRSYKQEGENPTQTTFYPGQKEQGVEANKFNNKRLDFDMRAAAIKLGLEQPSVQN